MTKKTEVKEVEYAEDVQEFITLNEDVSISSELKEKVMNTPKIDLLLVTKTIGSHPIKIVSAIKYTEEYLLENF